MTKPSPSILGRPPASRFEARILPPAARAAIMGMIALAAPGQVLGAAQAARTAQEPPGTVRGRVISAETAAPVEGAAVEIRHGGTSRFYITGPDGAYRATGLTPGLVVVVARALDRAPLETGVQVPAGGEVPLDLALELRPILMPSLLAEISSRRLAAPGLTRDGFREEGETELRALEATPGVAELGLTAGASRHDPNDPGSVLYVRGAGTDLKLVLLDGAPVFAPFHLSGLLDAFPHGVLEDASLYIGGTPARYDGGLSYVLDLEVRQGDSARFRTAGAVDLLGATARVEGPLGSSGRVLVSGRTLHGLGYPLVTGEDELPYGYGDVLARVDAEIGPGQFSATGFWNRESVQLNIGKLEETGAAESAYWGNLAGSMSYRVPVGGGALTVLGAYGRFNTQLPVPRDEGEGPVSFANALGRTQRTRSEVLYESGGDDLRWAAGGGFDTYETVLDQRTVFGDTTAHTLGRANTAAAWGEAIWDITPEVELRAGARTSYFAPENIGRFAPRATVTWHVSESADLRLSAGRFFQVVRGPESILSSDLTGPTVGRFLPGLDTEIPSNTVPILGVAGATHLVVGLENRLENGIDVGVEGYFKSFDDLPDTQDLYASGADLWVEAREGPVRGWVGYSLAWVWTSDPSQDTRFVGRQLLSGGLSTQLSGFDLGLRLAYGSGLPFTSISPTGDPTRPEGDVIPALSGAAGDSYLRLDAEISRRLITRVGNSRVQIAPYLRLLNALDRRDALFYQAGTETPTQPVPLASLPLIAVFGVAWSF